MNNEKKHLLFSKLFLVQSLVSQMMKTSSKWRAMLREQKASKIFPKIEYLSMTFAAVELM